MLISLLFKLIFSLRFKGVFVKFHEKQLPNRFHPIYAFRHALGANWLSNFRCLFLKSLLKNANPWIISHLQILLCNNYTRSVTDVSHPIYATLEVACTSLDSFLKSNILMIFCIYLITVVIPPDKKPCNVVPVNNIVGSCKTNILTKKISKKKYFQKNNEAKLRV